MNLPADAHSMRCMLAEPLGKKKKKKQELNGMESEANDTRVF